MRPDGIVVPSPSFDHDLCLFQRVEDLTIEQLITKLSVEAFAVAIFPGTAWFDVGGLGTHGGNPSPKCQGNELWAVVRPDMGGNASLDEEIAQRLDDLRGLQRPGHTDGNRFTCKLIDDAEHTECLSIVGAVRDEVVGPHMVGALRPQTDARSVVEPEPTPFGLFRWDFQPLTTPDALNTLPVHHPPRCPQKRRDPAVSVAAILAGKLDDVGCQSHFIVGRCRHPSLRGPMLSQSPACPPLRYTQFGNNMVHTRAATCGA